MPEILKAFLRNLSDDDANKLWDWLDENPDAVEEMIDEILDSHPGLNKDHDCSACGVPCKPEKA